MQKRGNRTVRKSRKMRRAKTRRQGQGQNGGKRGMGRNLHRGIAGGGPVFGI